MLGQVIEWLTPARVESVAIAILGAAIASFAGAWGGAHAAQRIADRARVRERLLEQIKLANTGAQLAYSVCMHFANAKEQHFDRLWSTYYGQRDKVMELHRRARKEPVVAHAALDFNKIDIGATRVAQLETLVMDRADIDGRARMLAPILTHSAHAVSEWLSIRDEQIEMHRASPEMSNSERIARYFGFPFGDSVDAAMRNSIDGLRTHTDDTIFYSQLLGQDLMRWGGKVRERYKREFGGDAPRIVQIVLTKPHLVPPASNYSSWTKGFYERVPKTHGRRLARCWFALRKKLRAPKRAINRFSKTTPP